MLTGTLGHLGCRNANTLMPANSFNEVGYYESAPISHLNDNLLISADSAWDDWHPVDPAWFSSREAAEFVDKASAVLDEEFEDAPLFSLKDPRICRLLPFWLEVFRIKGISPVALHIHRNPVNVAASLLNRDELAIDYSHILWLHNMLEAEAGSRGLKRFFTTYTQTLADWERVATDAAQALDITWPTDLKAARKDIQDFIQPKLMHFNEESDAAGTGPISDWVHEVYDIFNQWAESGETSQSRKRLDTISKQVSKTLTPFTGILDAGLNATRARSSSKNELNKVKARGIEEQADLKQMKARLDKLEQDTKDQTAQITHLQETAARRKAAIEHWKGKIAELTGQVEQLKLDKMAMQSDADHRIATLGNQLEQLQAQTQAQMTQLRDQANAEMAGLRASNVRLQEKTDYKLRIKQAQIRSLQAAFEEAHFASESMRNSTSWRVTAPLRRFKSKFQN